MTSKLIVAALALATLTATTSVFAADYGSNAPRRHNSYSAPTYNPRPTYQPAADYRPARSYKPVDDYQPVRRPRPAYGY